MAGRPGQKRGRHVGDAGREVDAAEGAGFVLDAVTSAAVTRAIAVAVIMAAVDSGRPARAGENARSRTGGATLRYNWAPCGRVADTIGPSSLAISPRENAKGVVP